MTDFNKQVNTPNGVGNAFAKMPDGKILVSHAWKKLTKAYREDYFSKHGHIARVVIEAYKEDDLG